MNCNHRAESIENHVPIAIEMPYKCDDYGLESEPDDEKSTGEERQ